MLFFSSFCCAKFIILVYMKKRGQGGGCKLQFQSHSIFHSFSIVCFISFSLCKSSFFFPFFFVHTHRVAVFLLLSSLFVLLMLRVKLLLLQFIFLLLKEKLFLLQLFCCCYY